MTAVNRSVNAARAVGVSQAPCVVRHVSFSAQHADGRPGVRPDRWVPCRLLLGTDLLTVKDRYSEIVSDSLERDFPGQVVRTGLLPLPLPLYQSLPCGVSRCIGSRFSGQAWGSSSAGGCRTSASAFSATTFAR